tara:strand:- start:171 stop:467 length:297 start_codon:yes stop_codon:yes gene_type:complete
MSRATAANWHEFPVLVCAIGLALEDKPLAAFANRDLAVESIQLSHSKTSMNPHFQQYPFRTICLAAGRFDGPDIYCIVPLAEYSRLYEGKILTRVVHL